MGAPSLVIIEGREPETPAVTGVVTPQAIKLLSGSKPKYKQYRVPPLQNARMGHPASWWCLGNQAWGTRYKWEGEQKPGPSRHTVGCGQRVPFCRDYAQHLLAGRVRGPPWLVGPTASWESRWASLWRSWSQWCGACLRNEQGSGSRRHSWAALDHIHHKQRDVVLLLGGWWLPGAQLGN